MNRIVRYAATERVAHMKDMKAKIGSKKGPVLSMPKLETKPKIGAHQLANKEHNLANRSDIDENVRRRIQGQRLRFGIKRFFWSSIFNSLLITEYTREIAFKLT